MKIFLYVIIGMTIIGCNSKNPFFSEYGNEYGIPPLKTSKLSIIYRLSRKALNNNRSNMRLLPTTKRFPQKTPEALELSGVLLNKVSAVFFNLHSAETNEELNEISQ